MIKNILFLICLSFSEQARPLHMSSGGPSHQPVASYYSGGMSEHSGDMSELSGLPGLPGSMGKVMEVKHVTPEGLPFTAQDLRQEADKMRENDPKKAKIMEFLQQNSDPTTDQVKNFIDDMMKLANDENIMNFIQDFKGDYGAMLSEMLNHARGEPITYEDLKMLADTIDKKDPAHDILMKFVKEKGEHATREDQIKLIEGLTKVKKMKKAPGKNDEDCSTEVYYVGFKTNSKMKVPQNALNFDGDCKQHTSSSFVFGKCKIHINPKYDSEKHEYDNCSDRKSITIRPKHDGDTRVYPGIGVGDQHGVDKHVVTEVDEELEMVHDPNGALKVIKKSMTDDTHSDMEAGGQRSMTGGMHSRMGAGAQSGMGASAQSGMEASAQSGMGAGGGRLKNLVEREMGRNMGAREHFLETYDYDDDDIKFVKLMDLPIYWIFCIMIVIIALFEFVNCCRGRARLNVYEQSY